MSWLNQQQLSLIDPDDPHSDIPNILMGVFIEDAGQLQRFLPVDNERWIQQHPEVLDIIHFHGLQRGSVDMLHL